MGIEVTDALLKNFERAPRWKVAWPGRAPILSLRGSSGDLDLVASYFPTGGVISELDLVGVHASALERCTTFPRLREHLRVRLAAALRPQEEALT